MKLCSRSGCQETAKARWQGKLLCFREYSAALLDDFRLQYAAWDGAASPPIAFRVIFARVIAELAELCGESYLSRARVRDRAFNYAKVSAGVRFEIVRHRHAWDGRQPMTRVVECWEASIDAMEYTRSAVRALEAGDPE
jgi:hypothetical protein